MKTLDSFKKKCKKCNHEWVPRVAVPMECPKCKNRNWNEMETKDEDKD